jgi:hypothetical protein
MPPNRAPKSRLVAEVRPRDVRGHRRGSRRQAAHPDTDYDIVAPWPDHRITIAYFSREALEEEYGYPHDCGVYQVETTGPRFGGACWDFQQEDLDTLIAAALRAQPSQPS